MVWSSKIPAAMDALFTTVSTAFAASEGLSAVKVRDSQTVGSDGHKRAFVVGYEADENGTAVESIITPEGAASSPDREQFTIWCAAIVRAGSGTVSAARGLAYAIAAAAGQAVKADPKLGGAVMRAYVSAVPLRQEMDPAGAVLVTVMVGVTCDAYTGR